MSGHKFNYALRPAKFVDRAMFVELLQYVDRAVPVRNATYIGFGGPSMEDHRALHAALGLKHLISLERDAVVFAQQKFNRPLREIRCLHMTDKNFLDELDVILVRAKADPNAPRITWFDYETPGELIKQLQNLQALIDSANDGDVIRITLNAHASSLGSHKEDETEDQLRERRFSEMKNRFAEFLPPNASSDDTTHAKFPSMIIEAARIAAIRATASADQKFLPLLITEYSDGQSMVTVTGIVTSADQSEAFIQKAGLKRWPYYSHDWKNIERIGDTPSLTLRERLNLDQATVTKSNRLPIRLDYLTRLHRATGREIVKSYRRYQRFIPRFQNVDI